MWASSLSAGTATIIGSRLTSTLASSSAENPTPTASSAAPRSAPARAARRPRPSSRAGNAQQAHVEVAAPQHGDLLAGGFFASVRLTCGKRSRKRAHPRAEFGGGDVGQETRRAACRPRRARRPAHVSRRPRRGRGWRGLVVERLAGVGDLDGTGRAAQELDLEFVLEVADLDAQRRLRDEEPPRAPARRKFLRDRAEVSKLAQFHGRSFGGESITARLVCVQRRTKTAFDAQLGSLRG